ncbi:MAG TPA: type II toxin-antitoxin system VapC family toxin [Acidimicrobiales bacterium]|nr:type II toxin-antitoxin system VapC family toxin [Acidimicrobiales bacterium]
MGLTVIDAGVLIGFLDESDVHHDASTRELESARRRGEIAIPASALAESMVAPARNGDSSLEAVREFIDRLPVGVAKLDVEIAIIAAQIRAGHGQRLKLPDALVVATAINLEANVLVTTDRGWPSNATLGFDGIIVTI